MASTNPRPATVESFDRATGRGVVRCDDGTELGFHATAVSDGSRDIGVGARVLVGAVRAHAGTTEAGPVTPI